jgi:hypothetical protein
MNTKLGRRQSRSCTGSSLAEAGAALIIVMGVVCAGVLLLANVAVSCFYKEKLCFVVLQTAQYAATLPNSVPDSTVKDGTLAYANSLLSKVAMPNVSSLTVDRDAQFATVHMQVSGLGLVGSGGLLPAAISLQDTEAASRQSTLEPMGFLWLSGLGSPNDTNPLNTNGVIPIYHQQPISNLSGYTPHRPYTLVDTYVMKFTTQNADGSKSPVYPGYSVDSANSTATPSFLITPP